jgi:hypothetical protein
MAEFGEIKQLRRMVDSSILRMPGVMAVATGYKRVGGKRTDELSVIVYVAKKLSLERMPYFHAIPSSLEIRGVRVPTDVVEVGYYVPYAYDSYQRPALGGDSIGHVNITAGTLGGLVCGPACEEEEDSVLILSNNHVLAHINEGQKGDHIVQPGVHDGGACHTNCIATLERFVPIDFSEGATNYVDCAVALPYDTSDVSFEIRDIGTPNLTETYTLTQQDVVDATQVQKTGRTTEHTVGYVSAVDWKGTVLYDWTPAYFEGQIVVETLDGNPVGLGGDSGSLVVAMDNKICGLLFAGPTSGTHYIANHIGEVFNRVNVRLCCTPSEAVRGTKADEFLPDLRRIRERLRTNEKLRKYFDLYGRHSGKFLEAMRREPRLGRIAQEIIVDVGKAIRDPRQRIDPKSAELGLQLIDAVSEMRGDDKVFLEDMQEAKSILKESSGKTVASIMKMLTR